MNVKCNEIVWKHFLYVELKVEGPLNSLVDVLSRKFKREQIYFVFKVTLKHVASFINWAISWKLIAKKNWRRKIKFSARLVRQKPDRRFCRAVGRGILRYFVRLGRGISGAFSATGFAATRRSKLFFCYFDSNTSEWDEESERDGTNKIVWSNRQLKVFMYNFFLPSSFGDGVRKKMGQVRGDTVEGFFVSCWVEK